LVAFTVVATTGQILVANENANTDIFWALRGGGGGQYGIVTEYVIKHYPAPATVALGTLAMVPVPQPGGSGGGKARGEKRRGQG
jgi:FAD/FMN-containing dehydrogenase